jgi:1-acyl-sn-glycerol-3-phosphate acyltransferase
MSADNGRLAEYERILAEGSEHFHCKLGRPGQSKWYHLIVSGLIRPFLLLLRPWQGIRIEGKANLPTEGPVIIVGNHESFFDPIVVVAKVWRPFTAYAKRQHLSNRWFGWFYRGMGQLPIERDQAGATDWSVKLGIQVLDLGGVLAVYPEGTRLGGGVYRFYKRLPVGLLESRPETPIVCLAVTYEPRRLFGRTAVIRVSEPFYFGSEEIKDGIAVMTTLRNWVIAATGLPDRDIDARAEKKRLKV